MANEVSQVSILNCHYSRKLALTQPLLSKAVSPVHGEIIGMDPRKFLDFFKSKTGKIILFLGLVGIGCILYHGFAPSAKTTKPEPLPTPQTSPEKNQPTSVDRGGSRFIIPGFLSLREQNNGGTNSAPTNAPPVLPISLYNSDEGEPKSPRNMPLTVGSFPAKRSSRLIQPRSKRPSSVLSPRTFITMEN
jgi:hypothetical protein